MHSTTRINIDFPIGDRGGNDLKLPKKKGAKNLHAVWDSVAYKFTNHANLPFSSPDWISLGKNASRLVNAYNQTSDP